MSKLNNIVQFIRFHLVLLLSCVALISACSAVEVQPKQITTLNKARLSELLTTLNESSADLIDGDKKEHAILMFYVAELRADYDAMGDVIDNLLELKERDPSDIELMAYLGSAYAVRARDYPWQGWYQIIPGPGFVRIYYVNRSTDLLDSAVQKDNSNPIVHLVRGITYVHLPRAFNRFSDGVKDLELLNRWIDNSQEHARFSQVLEDPSFKGEVLFRLGEAYMMDDAQEKARAMFARASSVAPKNSPLALAAKELAQ